MTGVAIPKNPEDVVPGDYECGTFLVSVRECITPRRNFFEVFVRQVEGVAHSYVDLHERFDWFGHFSRFERPITVEDLEEYNARVGTIFHKIAMPIWRLSRHSIAVRLKKLCETAKKVPKTTTTPA